MNIWVLAALAGLLTLPTLVSATVRGILGDIWYTGNWWARRVIIGAITWPLLILFVGLIGSGWFTALFTIVSGATLISLITWFNQPLIPVVAAFSTHGRIAFRWVVAIFALEVTLGAYLAVVPVGTNGTTRGMAIVAILCMVTAMLIKIGNPNWKLTNRLLWWSSGILTLLIFLYSWMPDLIPALHDGWMRDQAQAAVRVRRGESIWATPPQQQATQPRVRVLNPTEPDTIQLDPVNWSGLVTLTQKSKWKAPGWVQFLPYGRTTPITVKNGNLNFEFNGVQTFQMRGEKGLAIFIPTN